MKNQTKPSVLLVARVSDVEQRKALPAQKKRLLHYAEQKHWKEDVDFRYVEFDETAYSKERKTFNELVITPLSDDEDLSTVVFDKIDRFSRDSSSSEKAALTKLFRSGKIEMHFPHDNLFVGKDSPAADLFRLDIGVALAAYYSNSISNNVKRRFDQLFSDGIWVHRAPIGYKNITVSSGGGPAKTIIVDNQRAHFIVSAFELRANGMPYSLIAKELIKAGFTSSRSSKTKLSKSGVEKIINNPFYYGVIVQNGKEYKHVYPPLIPRSLFNRCKLIKDDRKSMKTKWDSMDFNLKDIVTCGKCGRAVSPFRSKSWVYLKCANPNCDNPNTAESLVMGSIEAVISQIEIEEELMSKVIDELKSKHDDQQKYYTQSITSVRTEYDLIDKKLEGWFDKLVDEKISPEQHDRIVEALQKRQADLNDKLDLLTKGNHDFQITASYLLDLTNRVEELFECADEGQRSKLIGFLLSNLQLNDKKLSFTVNYPFSEVIREKQKEPEGSKNALWCG